MDPPYEPISPVSSARQEAVNYYCTHVFGGGVAISLIGCVSHFAYEWSGCSSVAGVFCAVNASVFEHAKAMVFPVLLWWMGVGVIVTDGGAWHCLCATTWAAYSAIGVFLAVNGLASESYSACFIIPGILCGQVCGAWWFARARIVGRLEVICSGVWLVVLVVLLFACTAAPPRWAYMFEDRGLYGPVCEDGL